jgi:hypothetical protein
MIAQLVSELKGQWAQIAMLHFARESAAILKERGENFWRRGFPNQGKHDSR